MHTSAIVHGKITRAVAIAVFAALFLLVAMAIAPRASALETLVNFQPSSVTVPQGNRSDIGETYGTRSGGLMYGWSQPETANTKVRTNTGTSDVRKNTVVSLTTTPSASWKIAVPNAFYYVYVLAGDPGALGPNKFAINGVQVINATTTNSFKWIEGGIWIEVTNNFIELTQLPGGTANAIGAIDLFGYPPQVGVQFPAEGATVNGQTSNFAYATGGGATSVTCRIDGGAAQSCDSPDPLDGLSEGPHQITVAASNAHGTTTYVRNFVNDTQPPGGALTSPNAGSQTTPNVTLNFETFDASAVTTTCSLDGGAPAPCSDGQQFTGLSAGSHMLTLVLTDAAGNTNNLGTGFYVASTPNVWIWTPADGEVITGTSATLLFTASNAPTSIMCQLDNQPAAACTSGEVYSSLAPGAHALTVTASNIAGATTAVANFTTQLPPLPTISITAPAHLSQQTTTDTSLEFATTGLVSSTTCQLDSASPTLCSSPQAYSGLSQGIHTLTARAYNEAGSTSASVTISVDSIQPAISIAAPANGSTVGSSFTSVFTVTDASPAPTVTCKIDSGAAAPCSSGQIFSGLTDGSHTFTVDATDSHGNSNSATSSFTSAPLPVVTITNPVNASYLNATSTSVAFSATNAPTGYTCKLDSAAAAPCTSGQTFSSLSQGAHTLLVTATNAFGNGSATTAFTVDTTAPGVYITSPATGTVLTTTALNLVFSVSDTTPVSVTCKLDNQATISGCTSPRSFTVSGEGKHTINVTATDFFGRVTSLNRDFYLQGPPLKVGTPSYTATAAGTNHACAVTGTGSVQCWGSNSVGQLGIGSTGGTSTYPVTVPALASGVTAITAGRDFTCALTSAGAVKCWGSGASGALGNGSSANRDVPVQVTGLTTGVKAIDAGGNSACAILQSNAVSCWGQNTYGQLGNGATFSSATPVATFNSSSTAKITVGLSHACLVNTFGAAKCWGRNNSGQLGNSSTTNSSQPVQVSSMTSSVTSISAGADHSCLTRSSAAYCWGANASGQLGRGSTTSSIVPALVGGALGNYYTAIQTGTSFTCGKGRFDSIACWGSNTNYRLGNAAAGSTSTYPIAADNMTYGWSSLNLGESFSCAASSAGQAKCWGQGTSGQIGNGSQATVNSIGTVTPLFSTSNVPVNFSATGATSVSCKLEPSGTPISNCVSPQTIVVPDGDNTVTVVAANSTTTTTVGWKFKVDTSTPIVDITSINPTGDSFNSAPTLAFTANDGVGTGLKSVQCRHSSGSTPTGIFQSCTSGNLATTASLQAGTYTVQIRATDWAGHVGTDQATYTVLQNGPTVNTANPQFTSTTGGFDSVCAVTATNTARCWGTNYYGTVGDGTKDTSFYPTNVSVVGTGITQMASGREFSCALTTAGGVKCWGENMAGQLGNGTTTSSLTAVDVQGLTSGVTQISADYRTACARTSAGAVKCWGDNNVGDLGSGTTVEFSSVPLTVSGLSSGVASISKDRPGCAVMTTGAAKCWGYNSNGGLGIGSTNPAYSYVPMDVSGLSSGVAEITSSGSGTSCALLTNGGLKCWGLNSTTGLTGTGSTATNILVPTDVVGLTSGVASARIAGEHACALLVDGSVKCWGSNSNGRLGDGTSASSSNVPVDVVGLSSGVASIGASVSGICAIMTAGPIKCWGPYNWFNGASMNRTLPTSVQQLYSTSTVPVSFTTANATSVSCKLDTAAAETGCTSPKTYSGLTGGAHSVAVTASSSLGTATSAFDFMVDIAAPTVSISAPANLAAALPASPTMTFSASDPAGSGIKKRECRVAAGSSPGGTFAPCTSSTTVPGSPLALGIWTLQVRVTDYAGNAAVAQSTFQVG